MWDNGLAKNSQEESGGKFTIAGAEASMSTKQKTDAAALELARAVYEAICPEAAILFGSRARGDHDEGTSDVDVMLVVREQPGQERKDAAKGWAEDRALDIYGKRVPVQLVWFDQQEYREQEQFVNTVVTRALREGVVMSGNPEEYSSRYDNEETEYEYSWTDYDNRIFHAGQHLFSFQLHDDVGASDLLIWQQA